MMDPNDILQAACNRLESLGVRMIPYTRPKATDQGVDEFIVVELIGGLRYNEIGGYDSDFEWNSGTLGVEIFVRDLGKAQDSTEANVPRIGELTKRVTELFPHVDKALGVEMARPYILNVGISDGNGFHYTRINVRVSTLTDSE